MSDRDDIIGILNSVPHRYPFLLVDRVIETHPGKRLTALKNVTINEPFFQGHFPGEPVMPGVLIIEALAQAGLILGMRTVQEKDEDTLVYFAGIDKARFKRRVVPGDQLTLKVELLSAKKRIWHFNGEATVDGKLACRAGLLAIPGKADEDANV